MIIYNTNINKSKLFQPLVYDEIPDVDIGTLLYDDFWDEQDRRMIEGYTPNGMSFITGSHYYYLNACKMYLLPRGEKKKKYDYPFYRELDRRLSYEFKNAEDYGYNLIIGKPRQVGLSWFAVKEVSYDSKFNLDNNTGVAVGIQNKGDEFADKLRKLEFNMRPEYAVSLSKKTDEEFKYNYLYNENKQSLIGGLNSSVYIQTMFQDAGSFEGKTFRKVLYEEAGLFKNLKAAYRATEPGTKSGATQFGISIVFGTGGEIAGRSKDYKSMWDAAKYEGFMQTPFKMKKVFIPATEFFPGEIIDDEGKIIDFFNYETGQTHQDKARDFILKELERAKKDIEGYIKVVQTYPLKESHIFQKTSGGVLDIIKLNIQLQRINEDDIPVQIKRGSLEWVDDEKTKKMLLRAKDTKEKAKIRIANNSKVEFIKDENYGLYYEIDPPINRDDMQHKPDIGGCDSYDEEAIEGKGSNGATVSYRTYSGPSSKYNYPSAYLSERGDSSNDDTFYENTLKMAVYRNMEILVEYSKIDIIKYFIDVNAEKYLKNKPDLRGHLNSKAQNEFGQRMTGEAKILVTRLLKAEIRENYDKYWFQEMLLDLTDYGDKNTDISMALGMCLLFKLEIFNDISDGVEFDDTQKNDFDIDYYYVDIDGKLKMTNFGNEDYSIKLEKFNPETDYNDSGYEHYNKIKEHREKEKNEADKLLIELKEKYGEDQFNIIMLGKMT
jgi:hypothetical protein